MMVPGVLPLHAQSASGELRLQVNDPSELGVKAAVQIVSEANQYSETLATDAHGALDVPRLPFGTYQVTVRRNGFAVSSQMIQIRSALPLQQTIVLKLSSTTQSVTVHAQSTLIDPDQAGSVAQVGSTFIHHRVASLPGRSLQDLVNSQPGWLYEGNAVLHPRGSEYQTQFVVDGIPLTDNRSPSFGPEIEANDVQSLSIYTAGIPAEYGRALGGVIEVNTLQNPQAGFHGQAVLSGGSFDTAGAFLQGQEVWGKNTFGASVNGNTTHHYLNPVVPDNFTNHGRTGDFSLNFARDFTPNDHLSVIARHELANFDIPNEYVQQAAGQRQTAGDYETMGIVSYQHIFSPRVLGELHGMVRGDSHDFNSNPQSTPVMVFQKNYSHEAYLRGAVTADLGRNEWKAGVESDNTFLHEGFHYDITDPGQYDPSTPPTFAFQGHRAELDQAAFVQDLARLGNWTIGVGVRWDHYQLLLNRQAVSPRLSISRFFPKANLVVHASYDRVFETPSSENILFSSSPAVAALSPGNFLRLPVEPSLGNYYEAGVSKALFGKVKLDANYYQRRFTNFADDDQLDNTSISFPISFNKALIYGAEAKLTLPHWGRFSGFGSYSYEVGNAWYPVTGGLFLGNNAAAAAANLSGHFPISQDQRNTFRGRMRYQLVPRVWVAGGAEFNSGLPFAFGGDPATALAQYGQAVVDRVNFDAGRIRPTVLLSASVGADLYHSEHMTTSLQIDGENLTNVVDVIDFGGLYSGNSIGPSRSVSARLSTTF